MSGQAASLDEYRRIFHAHDWQVRTVGPMAYWPLLLRRSVDLLLDTPQPSFITWGEAHEVLFNGAFAAWLGPDHADSLGKPFPELWNGAWPNVAPFFRTALEGRGVLAEDIALPSGAGAANETRYATFSYAPLRTFDDQVIGVIGICTDTTEKVRAKARLSPGRPRSSAARRPVSRDGSPGCAVDTRSRAATNAASSGASLTPRRAPAG